MVSLCAHHGSLIKALNMGASTDKANRAWGDSVWCLCEHHGSLKMNLVKTATSDETILMMSSVVGQFMFCVRIRKFR